MLGPMRGLIILLLVALVRRRSNHFGLWRQTQIAGNAVWGAAGTLDEGPAIFGIEHGLGFAVGTCVLLDRLVNASARLVHPALKPENALRLVVAQAASHGVAGAGWRAKLIVTAPN